MRETGTGQQVAQIHDRYTRMMISGFVGFYYIDYLNIIHLKTVPTIYTVYLLIYLLTGADSF
jgi:hypothetical protein